MDYHNQGSRVIWLKSKPIDIEGSHDMIRFLSPLCTQWDQLYSRYKKKRDSIGSGAKQMISYSTNCHRLSIGLYPGLSDYLRYSRVCTDCNMHNSVNNSSTEWDVHCQYSNVSPIAVLPSALFTIRHWKCLKIWGCKNLPEHWGIKTHVDKGCWLLAPPPRKLAD